MKRIAKALALTLSALLVFNFAGCKTEVTPDNSGIVDGGGADGSGNGGSDNDDTGDKGDGSGETGGDSGDTGSGSGGGNDGSGEVTPPDPIISGPVEGGPAITKSSNEELETAYVEWTAADNAKWYNVYCSEAGADSWTKLDAPLVRQYEDYFRADALGLKAGTYDMKVVPVAGDDTEAAQFAATASGITVKAHERLGYAFVNNTSSATASGAYNMDGTLKSDAVVLYVTDDNWQTVSITYGSITVKGIDNILGEGYKSKKGATKPLCVRIVGSVGDGSKLNFKAGGDLELKGLDQGVTLEGVGNDATANGWGAHITTCSNVEIRNLAFMEMQGTTKDGVSIESNCHHIWVHNCDFFYGHNWGGDQKKGDGSLDTKGSTNITHSYNHFWDSGKCNLQGMESASDSGVYQITYHHNWYDHSDSRHPRIRRASVHVYNNYFDGNAKYGVGVTNGANAFVENNYFRSTATMRPMLSSMQGTDATAEKGTFSGENGGMIKAFGNKFDCLPMNLKLLTQNDTSVDNIDCYKAENRNEKVPETYTTKQGGTVYNNFDTTSDFYTYSVDTPDWAREKVMRYAGRVDGGDLKYSFDNATQDANYDLIPELQALISSYKSSVVKIGSIASSSGDSGSSGDGGSTGGDSGSGDSGSGETPDTPIDTSKSTVVTFDSFASGSTATINGVTITGNLKSGIAPKTYGGTTYTTALKMESSTNISFTLDGKATLTLITDAASKSIKIDGNKVSTNADYVVLNQSLEAGSHSVTKGDTLNLYAIIITPSE